MTAEQNNIYGTLYLCATPIGNLEDMTPRALRMLQEADLIAAEDTRHTLQLLNHFNIKGRLVRYDEHSKDKQGEYLLGQLLEGKNVALVSDAGFPGIADPGEALAHDAIAHAVCRRIRFSSAVFYQRVSVTDASSWSNGSIFLRRLFFTKHRTGLWRC